MRRRWFLVTVLIAVIATAALLITQFAPQLTALQAPAETTPESAVAPCLTDESGECYRMPAVTGVDIDNQEIAFPQAFREDYYLVVMPYDRAQQEGALTWLEPFQVLAAEHESLSYFSIAALPDLSAPIRLLVIGGLTAGVRDATVRSQVAVLFLEDQAAFLAALGVDDADDMSAFVMDRSGAIYWSATGVYTETAGEELESALAVILP